MVRIRELLFEFGPALYGLSLGLVIGSILLTGMYLFP